ncbi:hypothetical protein KL930_004842 [Ogataea haglerorum]|nr:hypothetical protein KL948_004405 [Ogataea haglerorum]KAG7736651.1 hypothetical protein KL923_004572 [Ogataea haglerorum]KAG7755030.1 hypothetical protein KL947_004524 [Ogataea haglerorum]KAG7762589.1 hypothetical protein KL931_005301 [Ogataea haglerorum]KAG7773059.1 hypothetical protein KL930_004842 [Ogataea haglerorum]
MSLLGYASDSDDDANLQLRLAYAPAIESRKEPETQKPNGKRTVTGFIETEMMDSLQFQRNKRLYEQGPQEPENGQFKSRKQRAKELKNRRKSKGDPGELDGENAYRGPWASYSESEGDAELEPEEAEAASEAASGSEPEEEQTVEETTTFYGGSQYDYLGRTYMHVPNDVETNLHKEPGSQRCYVPKTKIHTFAGHARGVQCLQFFPNSGHLLLTCGNDSSIKLWDVYHKRKLLRGFYGHMKPVKCVAFNSSGSHFLSCSYDETVKLWNTETGECEFKTKLDGIPNVVRFIPDNDNEFLVGMSNKRIDHYDMTTGDVIQSYEHHTDAVNSIEFINYGENFVSSSSDKSLRIWEVKVNMPVKLIADPKQFSMPYLKVHPKGFAFVAQSSDNTIQTFAASAEEKFKRNRDKTFTGHNSANFSIGLQFTPDGRTLMSGDSHGFAFFWDWRSTELISKLKVSSKPITCIDSHPQESSMVALAGADGKVYLYN